MLFVKSTRKGRPVAGSGKRSSGFVVLSHRKGASRRSLHIK